MYCCWLAELLLYVLYNLGGLTALFIFRYAIVAFVITSIYLYARSLGLIREPLVHLLCLLVVLIIHVGVWAKPEALSLVFITALAWNWWALRNASRSSVRGNSAGLSP